MGSAENRVKELKSKYGLTPEDFDQLYDDQDGRCAICGKHLAELDKRLHVDHDHNWGGVRGLLCFSCNVGLGHFQDNPDLLQNAIDYLEGVL